MNNGDSIGAIHTTNSLLASFAALSAMSGQLKSIITEYILYENNKTESVLFRAYSIQAGIALIVVLMLAVGLLNYNRRLQKQVQDKTADLQNSLHQLRENQGQLRATLEANPNPAIVYDNVGHPLYLSPAFTKVFGWSFDELKEQKIPFVPVDQKKLTASKIKELFTYRESVKFLTKRLTKQGKLLDVYVSAAILDKSEQKGFGMVVNLIDISEQLKLESQLQQAQKMESVGRLAGGVAHDFNNMLGVISGHTELALLQADETHALHADLKEIQKAAKHSADITKQLLAFARKQTISPKRLALNDTVESMLNILRRLIGED
ncbi:MAG: PAS domain S-box protein, partial [Thermodesulfobacteriota bacterium]|nr:PAS domain S-box protein [Thermodesulfobacteriota bacterium]